MRKTTKVYIQQGDYSTSEYLSDLSDLSELIDWQRVYFGPRIRIFRSNGKVEWMPVQSRSEKFYFDSTPCWLTGNVSQTQAIRLMRKFDKEMGFPKAVLLEEYYEKPKD